MDKLKNRLKESALYYWFVLIVWSSIVQAIPVSEFKGRIIELAISLVIGFGSVLFLGQTGQIPDIGLNLYTLLSWLGATFILRFLFGLITLPSKLHFDMKKKVDRFTWNDTPMELESIEHYGICLAVNNKKSDYIHNAGAELIFLQKGGKIEAISQMPLPWVKPNGYTWQKKKIDKKGEKDSQRILVLAQWNKKEAWLETRISAEKTGIGKIPLELDVDYKIRIKWFGEVDGRGMDECIREYWLKYDGENIIAKAV